MSFFDILILDTILTLFPVICILIIKANIMSHKKIDDKSLIDVANVTSLFLLIKYCDINNAYMVLLVNMPLIISVIYNRKLASTIILVTLMIFNVYIGTNTIFLTGEYLIYLIIFVLLNKKGISDRNIILTFIFIKGIFLTIHQYYILKNTNVLTIVEIFICLLTFYFIGILIISIINMIDKIITLNQSLKELEKEKNLKNSLFKITHEVKNPLAVCKGYFQMMDYSDIDKTKKYNQIIQDEINRTLDIMDNFSEYTKIKINTDIMDIDYLISNTINSMSSVFEEKNITVNYEEQGEVLINGDYYRLKQVLINILKNSAEAIEEEGTITVRLQALKKNIIISIKDNGCGMSKEELEKISELFYSTKDKGCGIGVSLSQEIINLHKGNIKYNSKLGKYTETIIKLPALKTLH